MKTLLHGTPGPAGGGSRSTDPAALDISPTTRQLAQEADAAMWLDGWPADYYPSAPAAPANPELRRLAANAAPANPWC